jgi:Zn-dependent protease with chaperone function
MTAMDFFGQQDKARTASGRLLFLFGLAVAGIIVSIYAAARMLLAAIDRGDSWFEPKLFGAVAALVLAVVAVATIFKTLQLRSGGDKVAELLGGIPIAEEPTDPAERQLRNVVEEIAIASGLPVPRIYVLADETAINAFAAGWSSADAAIGITRGALNTLNRDELQGVIAHEFSHVFHGDMRLNIRLMGVLFGIVCIATIGRILTRSGSRTSRRDSGGLVMFGVALVAIGWLGVLFARMIQAAVSRQREYLADASAVQYTRNPHGIGMALAKIGGLTAKLQSPHTEEASHLLFADGIQRSFGSALATHPPLVRRIEAILPGFSRNLQQAGSATAAVMATAAPGGVAAASSLAPVGAPATVGTTRDAGGLAAVPVAIGTIRARELAAAVGHPEEPDMRAARALLANLPMDLAAATHDRTRAPALVMALLLDREPARRDAQLRLLPNGEATLLLEVRSAFQAIQQIDRRLRLPLFELTMPALRAGSDEQRVRLRQLARALAFADGVLSPFEFSLLRTLERTVRLPGELPLRPTTRPQALIDHPAAVAVVLSVLARVGADAEAAAEAAFWRALQALDSSMSLSLLPAPQCNVAALEAAIDALFAISPLGKRNLIAACAEAAGADGRLTPDEADLLRALAGLWDCPVPLVAGRSD